MHSFELKDKDLRSFWSTLVKAYLSGRHFLHCQLQAWQVLSATENFSELNLMVLWLLREMTLVFSISEKGKIFE
jgi:hypothetical protein